MTHVNRYHHNEGSTVKMVIFNTTEALFDIDF